MPPDFGLNPVSLLKWWKLLPVGPHSSSAETANHEIKKFGNQITTSPNHETTRFVAPHQASSTSLTFLRMPAAVNGFWMKATPRCSRPVRNTASSV